MIRPEKPGELEKFIAEISDGDAKKSAANGEIVSRFKRAEAEIPAEVKERVRARLEARRASAPRPFFKKAAPALAACAAGLLLAVSLYSPRPRETELSPDWRSYYNYPSYADEAGTYLMDVDPDWRSFYNFPGWEPSGGR